MQWYGDTQARRLCEARAAAVADSPAGACRSRVVARLAGGRLRAGAALFSKAARASKLQARTSSAASTAAPLCSLPASSSGQ